LKRFDDMVSHSDTDRVHECDGHILDTIVHVDSFYAVMHNSYELHCPSVCPSVWWKGNINKNSMCYNIVHYYNGAQRYEQFSQVG